MLDVFFDPSLHVVELVFAQRHRIRDLRARDERVENCGATLFVCLHRFLRLDIGTQRLGEFFRALVAERLDELIVKSGQLFFLHRARFLGRFLRLGAGLYFFDACALASQMGHCLRVFFIGNSQCAFLYNRLHLRGFFVIGQFDGGGKSGAGGEDKWLADLGRLGRDAGGLDNKQLFSREKLGKFVLDSVLSGFAENGGLAVYLQYPVLGRMTRAESVELRVFLDLFESLTPIFQEYIGGNFRGNLDRPCAFIARDFDVYQIVRHRRSLPANTACRKLY